MNTIKTILIGASAFAVMCVTLAASQAAGKHMVTGGITSQPIGHAYFCQQYPSECSVVSGSVEAPKLTRKRWKELVRVNAMANRSIEPITDQDLYGVEEHWTYPKKYGDCEDYALLKRFMLIKRGWPESSLLITVVKQSNGEGHAVLTARTDRGDFILDNLATRIEPWTKTSYKFLKRQSTQHSGRWTAIKDTRLEVANY